MKKNEKGFTLVELLAVIVVLGIIMAIAGTAVLKQKKEVNKKEAKQIENSIKELGSSIYSYEFSLGDKSMDTISGAEVINETGKIENNYNNFICENSNFYCMYKKIDNPMGTCLDDSTWSKDNMCIQKAIKYNGKYYRTDRFAITISELADKGYLKDTISITKSNGETKKYIKSPFGNGYCDGYLRIIKSAEGPKFAGFIKCGSNGNFDDYKTSDYEYVTPGNDNRFPGMFTATIKDSSN